MAGLSYTSINQTRMATGEVYCQTLIELAKENPRIVALTADLGKSSKIGEFMKQFPERFYQFGIAEQNMMGAAAGMAKAGTTHHSTEDIAIMRSLANLTVIVPADGIETANAVEAAVEHEGPVYIRINRGYDQQVYETMDYGYEIGRAVTLHEGSDVTIIACGSAVFQALQAARELDAVYQIKARVLDMHTIKPLDKAAVLKAVKDTRRIITAEDHTVIGGLGGAVAEVIAESGMATAFRRLGLQDKFSPIGLHEDLMAHHGIDTNGIVNSVRELMQLDFEEDLDWEDEV